MRVLILEDDPLIALDLQNIVEEEGHQVVDLCGSLAEARDGLSVDLDFALLDIEVRDGTAYALATLLRARRIPFAFVSGSKRRDVPASLRGAPFIAKPFLESAIKGVLPASWGAVPRLIDAGSALIGDERLSAA